MARQRIDRKELKRPDQFITKTVVVFEWAQAHMREILYGIIGVVILVGMVLGWTNWQRSQRNQAAELLHQALKLAKPATPRAGTPNTTPGADPDRAIEKLVAITEDYGSTPAGAQAYWHLGHLYFAKGDARAALKAFEAAQSRFSRKQTLSVALAALNVAYAKEAVGDCEQAIASYEAVQQSSIGWLHGDAYLGMGRCYESNGHKDKAIAVYDRALADSHITSQTQEAIHERLAQLQPPINASKSQ